MKSLSDVHVFNPVRHPDFALHRVRMEFKSPEVERRFQVQHLSQSRRSLRTALIFCGCFYLVFFATDVAALGFSREAGVLLLARLFVASTVAAGLYLVRVYPDSVTCAHIAATTAEAAGMGVFMLIVLHRPHEIAMHAMSQCIMLAVIYILIPNRLLLSAGVALAATAGFIAIIISIGTIEPSEALTMSMLLMLTNGFGLVAARRHQQLLRDQFRAHWLLKALAIRDHLTACFNRRYLHDELLGHELKRARRKRSSVTVILCDIDHFKAINDVYGHLCGDAVLRKFAALLQARTREHIDSVVRYGGEEFLLLLQTDLSGALLVAERLRYLFAESSVEYEGARIAATASFGVAAVNFSGDIEGVTEEAIIAAADRLLYQAKSAGRNNVQSEELICSMQA